MEDRIELPHSAYILPAPIADWPPAWWFWLVLAVVLLGLLSLLAFWLRRHYKRQYRREALCIVNQHYQKSGNDQAFVKSCLESIKRCLQTEGQQHLASLPAATLFPKLDQQVRHRRNSLTPLVALFETGLYQANAKLSADERRQIFDATRTWIRKHHA
ncbi:DUF4381 domain-containing protein [Marinomonas ostreistagni]|uniref:DUF4381 domain-containing protein n=1 Tax=Marinomonas ostreistagni TaxID=359209 RepID=UPI0019521E45|nr:DUF4381 domain-containing protein [Marinomonas ostreistagni]MBM6551940.1 DUF4381 domain-containing protein [Marinomonas ostreistagni]